ncbi:hypothetical protein [Paenibacillus sp. NPDC058071]|uniref:hypothetical protein n=1 Tax=Paenibacillus sp. NPDC058071 TaxID=3346326 RepID=UPI0036DBDE5C
MNKAYILITILFILISWRRDRKRLPAAPSKVIYGFFFCLSILLLTIDTMDLRISIMESDTIYLIVKNIMTMMKGTSQ